MKSINQNKSKTEAPALVQVDQIGLNVGMDETINVFIAQYEDNCHAAKKESQTLIKSLKASLKDQLEVVDAYIKDKAKKAFAVKKMSFDLVSELYDVQLGTDSIIAVISISDPSASCDRHGYGSNHLAIKRKLPFDATAKKQVKAIAKTKKQIEDATDRLREIIQSIGEIGRKERQVRGIISRNRLIASGNYDDILKNTEIKKLISEI